jgi:hypothetical protein
MQTRIVIALTVCLVAGVFADSPRKHFEVKPDEFDPAHTHLVQAAWLEGIGCPTGAKTFDGSTAGTFTDPACPTGDTRDKKVEGLLMAKTGPTTNFAAAFARVEGVRGEALTELGWDIRKPGTLGPASSNDPRGSHCGAGAPRWNVKVRNGSGAEGLFFIGCNSPPPVQTTTAASGYVRMRWGAPVIGFAQQDTAICPAGTACDITGLEIRSLAILFDEGYDTGPDNFGMAILDNIDVNGILVGKGPTDADAE